jgi:protein-L-isoaspartate(D-aspartate) O-methyltransferase
MEHLIASLQQADVLKRPAIERALRSIDRKHFVPSELSRIAYTDEALPIGEEQTISQPYTVVFMLERLQAQVGDHVLDIGCGSGWQTTLLAHIIGEAGHVYAIERVSKLCVMGERNVAHYPELAARITMYCQDAMPGLLDTARSISGFSHIIAAAAVGEVPSAWVAQLRVGGRLVYPSGHSLFCGTKQDNGTLSLQEFPGFAFVPFVEK